MRIIMKDKGWFWGCVIHKIALWTRNNKAFCTVNKQNTTKERVDLGKCGFVEGKTFDRGLRQQKIDLTPNFGQWRDWESIYSLSPGCLGWMMLPPGPYFISHVMRNLRSNYCQPSSCYPNKQWTWHWLQHLPVICRSYSPCSIPVYRVYYPGHCSHHRGHSKYPSSRHS